MKTPPRKPAAYRSRLGAIKRLVIKLGSSTLAAIDLDALVDEVVALRARGVQVALVTSGAVAFGMDKLKLAERPTELTKIQALAAVGQVDLMTRYQRSFSRHGVAIGQVLITHEGLSRRKNFINARHTLGELFALGAVPIVNENDTVAAEELRFGDNDRLAAAIATVIEADLIILLSDIDALYDADPRVDPGARPIHEVSQIDAKIWSVAGRAGSEVGTGGMFSKVQAAEIAAEAGISLVIAPGERRGVVSAVVSGEVLGTRFSPNPSRADRRRHWIGFLSALRGAVVVDEGAAAALRERGSSLLPIGVVAVRGQFERGDGVAIETSTGALIARGLVGYSSDILGKIIGRRSDEVAAILERSAVDPVVHRNDMLLTADAPAR